MNFPKLVADRLNKGRAYGAPAKLAEAIGYSKVTTSEWVRGDSAPGEEALPLLAKVLGVTEQEIKAFFPQRYGTAAGISNIPAQVPEIVENLEVLGVVSGETFKEPFEDAFPIDSLPIPYRPRPGQKRYGLRISGDCMAPKAKDGDYAIVVTTNYVPEGETGVICYDGECTLKKIHYDGEFLDLIPHNKEYKPLRVKASRARIIGICVGYFTKP